MKNNRAFTLIELLVVVLIIGVLSAIALPQYQNAVLKTRVMAGLVPARAIMDAMDEYYLANGNFSGNWSNLTINLPAGATDENGVALTSLPTSMDKYLYYGVGTGNKRHYRLQSNGKLQYQYYTNDRPVIINLYSRYATSDSYKDLQGKVTCTYGSSSSTGKESICKMLGATKLSGTTSAGTYVF